MIDAQRLSIGAGDRQLLVAELQATELGVLYVCCSTALRSSVVAGPQLAETLATHRQLPDELVQLRIVGIGADERRSAATIAAAARSQSR